MKKFILICIACLSIFYSKAQENYLPGYVVLRNDTIRGQIDFRDWERNPERISFKDQKGLVFFYEPLGISAFSVANETYESATVDIEVSSDKLNELTNQSDFIIEKQTAFLQSVVGGKKSLLALTNKIGKQNFYIKKENGYELLLYKRHTLLSDVRQTYKNNRYQGQLALYLNDCPMITKKLSTRRYTKKDLADIFAIYYECTGQTSDFVKSEDKIKLEWTVLAGVSNTNLKLTAENFFSFIQDIDFGPSLKPTGGISFNVVLPRNRGRFSINNELVYSAYAFAGEKEEFTSEDQYTITNVKLEASQLKLNTLLRVKIPLQKTNLRLEAGMANAFALSTKTEWIEFRKFFATEETTKSDAIEEPRKYEIGVVAGVGLEYNRLSLTARFEVGNGMSNWTHLTTTMQRLNFMVGYRLTK